jgi:ATP-dependent helicase YprA (DUF1998 family)
VTETFDPLVTSDLITTGYRRYLRSLLPVRDPAIAQALDQAIGQSRLLTNGPLLEATPPYAHGATVNALIAEGILSEGFRRYASHALPPDRRLYVHQEEAIRKIALGRNVIVATGTGSGKTESFLLPILDALAAEQDLGPGVRALLLYPMNALANDQLKRLRQLLAVAPHVTFGRYVGDTPERTRDAEQGFALLNSGEPMLPNELLSREQMRARPPHILLTNYAMLEYLLLRPADMDLFEGPCAGKWRFLVLDEAHVYDGARAAEVAMLLRRLRDRVAQDNDFRCIATSATVGDDPAKVTEFAAKLFAAPFEWIRDDPNRQDLVRATRLGLPQPPYWGPLAPEEYPAAKLAGGRLATERRMARLRELLAQGPRPADQLATVVFDDVDDAVPAAQRRQWLDALVGAGSRTTMDDGMPVLSARYHLFVRATEGAFTCLSETGPHVSLSRRQRCDRCDAAAFEFGTCKRCGGLYLLGSIIVDENGVQIFGPQLVRAPRTWLLVDERPELTDEDDAALDADGDKNLDSEYHTLCVSCGSIRSGMHAVGCVNPREISVRKLRTRQDSITGCLACGARGAGQVRAFESGSDAAASVVATALYQALPPGDVPGQEDLPGEGRKLLSFSDSRQAAAFFAPYLQDSYETLQHRRLIFQGLQHAVKYGAVSVDDLIRHVVTAAEDAGLFMHRETAQTRREKVALWIMIELVTTDIRQSLEGQGLLRVTLDRVPHWPAPASLIRLGLAETEAWHLLAELARSVRQQGAVTMPSEVKANDEAFAPRIGPIYLREMGSETKRKVMSWLPVRSNRRLDYTARVLNRIGCDDDPVEVLADCWRFLDGLSDGWFEIRQDKTLGVVRQLDHRSFRLEVPAENGGVWQCRLCRAVAPVSVRGVCPTLGCGGDLALITPDEDSHYRYLYKTLNPVQMAASEHTAQLSSQYAAEIQQKFVRGELNVLSCSTTFELGVDVGELQTVIMRNMPPSTANYVQRAGRAGRRASSAALAVTYAQRRSHDLSKFADPVGMIAGAVRAPYVPLGNERIDRRHAHSIALAAFFRQEKLDTGEQWATAGAFFLGPTPPVRRVREYLTPVPEELTAALRRVLPDTVQAEIGVKDGTWAEVLCDLLEYVRAELAADVAALEERRDRAAAGQDFRHADVYKRTINTLAGRGLIGMLANRNVLPKYGFPTDTVELRTGYSGDPVGDRLDLSRDLTSAIYEYAPGAEIVAGGRRWTSAGVYRLPEKELIASTYAVCPQCGSYEEGHELGTACRGCGTERRNTSRIYVIPEFGFVAARKTDAPGQVAPRRSWHGATYVRSLAEDLEEREWSLPGGARVTSRAGERCELVAIGEGRGGAGYLICDRCGWGQSHGGGKFPKAHADPRTDRECRGTLQHRSLAHRYETDLLEVTFDRVPAGMQHAQWRSVLYALLEGASELFDISRDDIDGNLYPVGGGQMALVLFDTVPGGAGGVLRVGRSLPEVLVAAHRRMERCECGEETSCYGCLRNFRNQSFHDDLSRGDALTFLSSFT